MYRQLCVRQCFCCVFVTIFFVSGVQASDWSEFLWGGRGSRTTVSDPYIPPPLMTETPVIPVTDSAALTTTQSHLMLGTPGATTLPPGGVIAANGVATTGVSSASYVWQSPVTTASNVIPAVQVTPAQPVIDYEWTYSTIKDIKYDSVSVYDPRLGGYVTTLQERQTESVLPWLHRKQVVRYKPTTTDAAASGTTISNPSPSVVTDTSERRIVNRLFPVSTVPSPPAQAVPVQTHVVPTAPITTYATPTYASETPAYPLLSAPVGSQIQVAPSTVMRIGELPQSDLPVMTAVTIPQSGLAQSTTNTVITSPATTIVTTQDQPASTLSTRADVPPSLPPVVSPSTQQVLYPTVSAGQARSNTQPNTPTPAPAQSEQTPGSQNTVTMQRPRIEDSIIASEKLRAFELPAGSTLPPPAHASAIPSLEVASQSPSKDSTATPNTTNSGIPLLSTEPQSTVTSPASQLPSATGTTQGRTVSPTQMAPPM